MEDIIQYLNIKLHIKYVILNTKMVVELLKRLVYQKYS